MKHKGTILLETNRLILRKFKITDSTDMFKNWGSDSSVNKFLSWPTHNDIEDSEKIINLWISQYDNEETYNWVIELKNTHESIGNISIVKLDTLNSSCEIGYCISSKYWNKGITTEAFKVVIKYLFEKVCINRICAKHDTNNTASGKVMQKCGMTYEGTLREVEVRNSKFYSLALYSILKRNGLLIKNIFYIKIITYMLIYLFCKKQDSRVKYNMLIITTIIHVNLLIGYYEEIINLSG